jgi:phenylpropionate dioxygenase-like ring-hydroxylating dioxygenase large terminal subunit
MTSSKTQSSKIPPVRADFVPKEDYISPEIADLERERLWPKAWLLACRIEEIPKKGDFVSFDIARESILIVRTAENSIKAYYNVCQHRGRRLYEGSGNAGAAIFCRFHGWSWNLDGSVARIRAREDWQGCQEFANEDLRLQEVRVGFWGGAVFVNMDDQAEPLEKFLAPVPEILNPFLLGDLRPIWYKTLVVPCNWKTVVDAFNEGYHTEATHPQMNKYGYPKYVTEAHGRHGKFYTRFDALPELSNTGANAFATAPKDARTFFRDYIVELHETVKAMYTEDSAAAARGVVSGLPETATPLEVSDKFTALHREIVERKGAAWPAELTPAVVERAGIDWHIFPNTILLPTVDGTLWYRACPNGDDVESAILDVWSLGRFKPGTEPSVKREWYSRVEDFKNNVPFLEQDFDNLRAVQRGMHSRGFKGARTNPLQEVTVSNFHRVLHQYLFGESNHA